MSLGNGNPKNGDKGSNFNYELKVLQGLQNIINNVLAGIDVTVVNPGGAGAVNIQDGGNSITVDGSVSISALPNEGQQSMANSISVALASDQAGVQRTPTFLRPAGLSGTIPAGRYSMSFANVGTINATVGGITLNPEFNIIMIDTASGMPYSGINTYRKPFTNLIHYYKNNST
jgi:hypothetical protein